MLSDKLKLLINTPTDMFLSEANKVKESKKINIISFPLGKPVLVYNKGNKNVIFYLLGLHYSLHKGKVLDYVITTGQNFINQHFLTEQNRDIELHNKLQYSDIAFIALTQFDYTSEYLESLIIDLAETRAIRGLETIVYYDVLDTKNYLNTTSKLYNYFNASHKTNDLTTTVKSAVTSKRTGERFI